MKLRKFIDLTTLYFSQPELELEKIIIDEFEKIKLEYLD